MDDGGKAPKGACKATPAKKRKKTVVSPTRRSSRKTRYRSVVRDEDNENPINVSDYEGDEGEVSSLMKDSSMVEYDDKKSTKLTSVKMELQGMKAGKKTTKGVSVRKQLPSIEARCSPQWVMNTVVALHSVQREAVREMGFGSLLDGSFDYESMPVKLGLFVVKMFDPKTCKFRFPNGRTIKITKELIHDITGFPVGGKLIRPKAKSSVKDPGVMEFRNQFPNPNAERFYCNIVMDKIVGTFRADRLFCLNFLVLVTSGLIESTKMGTVLQTILDCIPESNEEIKGLDWCEYILDSMIRNTLSFKTSFNGPLLIMMLIYVNSTKFVDEVALRVYPAFSSWNSSKLKDRQIYEISFGGFGLENIMIVNGLEEVVEQKLPSTQKKRKVSSDKVNVRLIKDDDDPNDVFIVGDEALRIEKKRIKKNLRHVDKLKVDIDSSLSNVLSFSPADFELFMLKEHRNKLFGLGSSSARVSDDHSNFGVNASDMVNVSEINVLPLVQYSGSSEHTMSELHNKVVEYCDKKGGEGVGKKPVDAVGGKKTVGFLVGKKSFDDMIGKKHVDAVGGKKAVDDLVGKKPFEVLVGKKDVDAVVGKKAFDDVVGKNPFDDVVGKKPFDDVVGKKPVGAVVGKKPVDDVVGKKPLDAVGVKKPVVKLLKKAKGTDDVFKGVGENVIKDVPDKVVKDGPNELVKDVDGGIGSGDMKVDTDNVEEESIEMFVSLENLDVSVPNAEGKENIVRVLKQRKLDDYPSFDLGISPDTVDGNQVGVNMTNEGRVSVADQEGRGDDEEAIDKLKFVDSLLIDNPFLNPSEGNSEGEKQSESAISDVSTRVPNVLFSDEIHTTLTEDDIALCDLAVANAKKQAEERSRLEDDIGDKEREAASTLSNVQQNIISTEVEKSEFEGAVVRQSGIERNQEDFAVEALAGAVIASKKMNLKVTVSKKPLDYGTLATPKQLTKKPVLKRLTQQIASTNDVLKHVSFVLPVQQELPHIAQRVKDSFDDVKAEYNVESVDGSVLDSETTVVEYEDYKVSVNVSDHLSSPHGAKPVNLQARRTVEEERVSRFVFSASKPVESVYFKVNDFNVQLCLLESLFPGMPIASGILDIWAQILNFEETKRDVAKGFRRVCCNTETLAYYAIDPSRDQSNIYSNFEHGVNISLMQTPYANFNDVKLVFFPILKPSINNKASSNHYYLICFNLKESKIDIIDNVKYDDKDIHNRVFARYGNLPNALKQNFVQYLVKVDKHPNVVNLFSAGIDKVDISWETSENTVDCGVFVMRHMECFYGNGLNDFNSGFDVEGTHQKRQLDDLRKKYVAKIVLSELNDVAEFVRGEVKAYDRLTEKARTKYKRGAKAAIMNRLEQTLGG